MNDSRPRKALYTHDSKEVRHKLDDYPTPFAFVDTLMEQLELNPSTEVHEPCAGGGWLVSHLRRLGFDPTFEDLVFSDVDYLDPDYTPPTTDWVITNPPYRLAEAFVTRALTHTRQGVAVLLNSSFIEGLGRAQGLFADYPPALILVNARKMRLRNDSPSVFAHYWVVWRTGYQGKTELRWLTPQGEIKMPPDHPAPGVWGDA